MARTARVVIPDVSLHIVQRGHDRSDVFFEDADYVAYLEYLATFAARFACEVHAYCLMTNHVHLLVTPRTHASCALMMKNVAQRYAQDVNRRMGRSGSFWESRFHSCLVASERYALGCYRYIELNPVLARMVAHASDYRWSSHAANAKGEGASFLRPHAAYTALAEDCDRRLLAYRSLCDTRLEDAVIDDIRKATRGGYVVGTKRRPRGRPWP